MEKGKVVNSIIRGKFLFVVLGFIVFLYWYSQPWQLAMKTMLFPSIPKSEWAHKEFIKIGPRSIPTLVWMMRNFPTQSPHIIGWDSFAEEVLADFGNESIQPLVKLFLLTNRKDLKCSIISSLSLNKSREAFNYLKRLLLDSMEKEETDLIECIVSSLSFRGYKYEDFESLRFLLNLQQMYNTSAMKKTVEAHLMTNICQLKQKKVQIPPDVDSIIQSVDCDKLLAVEINL